MFFRQIADPELAQYAYLIGCQKTGEALLIDPERDIDRYLAIAASEGLKITGVAETHIHADFLSGAKEFAARGPVRLFLSDEGPAEWKYEWINHGAYDVKLLKDGDTFKVGNIEIGVVHTPGHTPEHVSYLVTDVGGGADSPMGIISGDFVFVGDLGRPDLLDTAAGLQGTQEPAARALYQSVLQFLQLKDHVLVWPGHGAGSACGKALGAVPNSTVGYERLFNASIQPAAKGMETFVATILDAQPEPPPYFGRMKKLNKQGPEVLGEVSEPAQLGARNVARLVEKGAVFLDTRADRSAFMHLHLSGALYAPLGSSLQIVAGSYVDPSDPILLIAEEQDVPAAVTSLMRIGYDDVAGYVTPDALESTGLPVDTTRTISFDDAYHEISQAHGLVLDVRGEAEFRTAHIPGALNIAHTQLEKRLAEVSKDETVFVHCQSGRRAAFAASLLERNGYDVVYIDGSPDDLVEPA